MFSDVVKMFNSPYVSLLNVAQSKFQTEDWTISVPSYDGVARVAIQFIKSDGALIDAEDIEVSMIRTVEVDGQTFDGDTRTYDSFAMFEVEATISSGKFQFIELYVEV